MAFSIKALPAERFRPLFALSDAELRTRGACRVRVDRDRAYPCRVSLTDARVGETVLLANYAHQPNDTPYRASHAVFVREGAATAALRAGEVPQSVRRRLISLRGFDRAHLMLEADVVAGNDVAPAIEAMLAQARTSYVHLHYAAAGCFAACAVRA